MWEVPLHGLRCELFYWQSISDWTKPACHQTELQAAVFVTLFLAMCSGTESQMCVSQQKHLLTEHWEDKHFPRSHFHWLLWNVNSFPKCCSVLLFKREAMTVGTNSQLIGWIAQVRQSSDVLCSSACLVQFNFCLHGRSSLQMPKAKHRWSACCLMKTKSRKVDIITFLIYGWISGPFWKGLISWHGSARVLWEASSLKDTNQKL